MSHTHKQRRPHIENVWIECVYTDCILTMFALFGSASSAFMCIFCAFTGFWGGQITAIHKASHTGRPPMFYKVLQSTGLIISREYHNSHHKRFNSHHSLLNGVIDRIFAYCHVLQTIECIVYLLTGAVAINSTIGLSEPARKTFRGRLQHLKWIIWYRVFDAITSKNKLQLRFMNWGFHPATATTTTNDNATTTTSSTSTSTSTSITAPHPMLPHADRVLPAEPNLRTIDTTSMQLYLHLLNGPGVDIRGKDIVEFSSGKGGGLATLAASGLPRSCLGIDLCEGNRKYCLISYKGIEGLTFKIGDAMAAANTMGIQADIILNVEASHCYPSRTQFFRTVHATLRKDGRLLFADFMTVDEAREARAALTRNDMFVLEKDEDITANVLAAMELTDAPKRELISRHIPSWLAPLVHRFAATKDSAMYVDLSGNEWVYQLFQARKA